MPVEPLTNTEKKALKDKLFNIEVESDYPFRMTKATGANGKVVRVLLFYEKASDAPDDPFHQKQITLIRPNMEEVIHHE